uniref:L-serine ammonia-lyase n=1 Tax=Candidatus Kentrum sp. DK TaxID=2126562 RepID=A0A450T084_9GAMM|nr:MAG: L-serine ammonia-lyase [Candidatus Kentron sp. DK]
MLWFSASTTEKPPSHSVHDTAMPLHSKTPLIESRALSLASRRQIRLKMETMQPVGSFKIRGIGAACEEYLRRGANQFISSSGGNAGIAVAYAGRHLSVPVIVVVPETTSERARELIRQEGARLIVHGATWMEANEKAQSMVGGSDAFLHPFDDPLLWGGHATLIDEIADSGSKPDAIMLAVGGGGLLSGVVEGLIRNGWADVTVVAVETEGAASFHGSIRAGHRIELDKITSIATSLGAKMVCERAFELAGTHPMRSAVVTDAAAVSACERFLDDQRTLVEPACGAALAAIYENLPCLSDFETIVLIVCGGATTTAGQLRQWSEGYP